LVFSTLHTNDAVSAVVRLVDLGVPHFLIRATLLGVMAQRLVRTLCIHCKKPGTLDEELWRSLIGRWKVNGAASTYAPGGCLECKETGYLGRAGIYEILTMTPTLRAMLVPDMDGSKVREQAIREGMRPLSIAGAQKVCSGLTTLEEVLRVAGFHTEL
jgi:general secretion pathway protein E